MAHLARYNHISLEPFDPGLPVAWTKEQMRGRQHSAEDLFIRGVRVITLGRIASLDAMLVAADEAFETVSEGAGAIVVPHTWGLVANPTGYTAAKLRHEGLVHPLLPEGLSLAAKVDTIRDIAPLPDEFPERLDTSVDSYHSSQPRYKWLDIAERQFAYGRSPDDTDREVYLLDIDARMVAAKSLSSSK